MVPTVGVTALLIAGVRESARVITVMVIVKGGILLRLADPRATS